MFSRRYSSNTGRGRARFTTAESQRYSDRYRSELVQSIHSSRSIYEAIVNNIRRENDMLFSMLQVADQWSATTPTRSENINNEFSRSNVTGQSLGTPTGVQRSNIQTNPFHGIFMDITNMLIDGVNSPEVNRGLTNEQISVAIQDTTYGSLPSDVRESHTTCPITLDQFEDSMEVGVVRACGHVFCRDAIINWLSTRHTCPSCRRDLNEPVIQGSGDATASAGQQPSVSSTHPSSGLHFINPTVRQTQTPNQQVNLLFDYLMR